MTDEAASQERKEGPAEKPRVEEKGSPPAEAEAPPDWKERYAYLLAEFDNFRKRAEREREAAVRAGVGRLVLKVIDLHDGIAETRASLPAAAKAVREGLDLLLKNLDALLKEEKIAPLARVGEPFRLDVHEAVGNVEPDASAAEGTVAHVVQQGFRCADIVLRPAKVLVAHHEAPADTRTREPGATEETPEPGRGETAPDVEEDPEDPAMSQGISKRPGAHK